MLPLLFGMAAYQNESVARSTADWPGYGLDYAETRNSELADINESNVSSLAPVWQADLSAISTRAFEATPIVVDGVMYVSTGWSNVLAFDASTGRELWRFDPKIRKDYARKGCCGPVSRGVAYAHGTVFLATYDGWLIALDAHSGKRVWSTLTVDQSKDYTITAAPRVIGDNVIIGNGGADMGVRGYVSAYNRNTGKLAWRFYTVPGRPGVPDHAASDDALAKASSSWSGLWWEEGGGGTVWDSIAYDPDLDLLYVGVGNAGPWNRKIRSQARGDNLFVGSVIALRPETGKYVWHFQQTPGDEWDYTSTQSIILANLEIGGVERKVLLQAPKNGFFYVLDRTTGQFISGAPYVKVTWAKGLDKDGRPIENASIRYSENGQPSLQEPGPVGGHNWQPMSFSAVTGLAYIPTNTTRYLYPPAHSGYQLQPGTPNMGIDGAGAALPEDAQSRSAVQASFAGELLAWDPVGQRAAWRIKLAIAWNGGTLVTDGGLVFEGTAQGDLVGYSARTGNKLWSQNLGAGIVAPPITYKVDGAQYVAVAVGWGGALPQVAGGLTIGASRGVVNRLVALKLNGQARLPPVTQQYSGPLISVRDETFSPQQIAAGKAIYERRCFMCHGSAVISGGEVPDLRRSQVAATRSTFKSVLLRGALATKGMPNYGKDLSDADADAIRAYIIARAQADTQADTKLNPQSN